MTDKYPLIPSHLVKALEDKTIPLIDLLHGHLKVEMLDAEEHLKMTVHREEQSESAMDSIDRGYAEGYLDALTNLYCMTYNLSIERAHLENV